MSKCEWCGKEQGILNQYTDAIGETHSICKDCLSKVNDCICRKCGTPTDSEMMINGLCTNCVQADMMEKSKKREEISMGLLDIDGECSADTEMSEADYDTWVTSRPIYGPKDLAKSLIARKMWIMVKLNASGIYDEKTIGDYYKDIETLLDRCLSKLIGNKCQLVIGNNAERRRQIREGNVIDFENEVYILAK